MTKMSLNSLGGKSTDIKDKYIVFPLKKQERTGRSYMKVYMYTHTHTHTHTHMRTLYALITVPVHF